LIQKTDPFASDGMPKTPPKNHSYNNNGDVDKSDKGNKQPSQRAVPAGRLLPRRAYDYSSSADDLYYEQASEIPAAENPVSYQFIDTPSSKVIGTSEVSPRTRALQGVSKLLDLQRRSAPTYGEALDYSSRPLANLRIDTTTSKAIRKRASPPSLNSAVRQYPASTKILTDRNSKVAGQEKSIKSGSSAWTRFLFPNKNKTTDAAVSGR